MKNAVLIILDVSADYNGLSFQSQAQLSAVDNNLLLFDILSYVDKLFLAKIRGRKPEIVTG